MYLTHKIICTICARGGSKGVPKKNLKEIAGLPLIAHTIKQAQQLKWIDRIIVSTDDIEIQTVAKKYGVEVPFLRPPELATDTAAKVPAIIDTVIKTSDFFHEQYDLLLDLDPTSPLRNIQDIKTAIDLLVSSPQTKSVFSVTPAYKSPYFNMVELNSQGYACLSKTLTQPIVRRQDAPPVFDMNASIYVMWIKNLLKLKTFFTNKTKIYIMPEERSIDIDRPIDFKLVELLMREKRQP